ncbi:MAG: hypothetical protein K0R73_241 [Candidatus Midichloriaceae bacterium]|jgi:hypothetical protein|nr:hypothetical protein [Candidatus Midichloriaceae bacterium]
MAQGYPRLRAKFKKELLQLLNDKAKFLIGSDTLKNLPKDTNFFRYTTGYDERLINKRADQLIESLPNKFFEELSYLDQQAAKEMMVEELFNNHIDLKQDLDFANFLLELFDKLLILLKDLALERQANPVEVTLKDPKTLSALDLSWQAYKLQEKNLSDSMSHTIITNFKRYINYLEKESKLLENATSYADLSKKLELLDEHISMLRLLQFNANLQKLPAVLKDIESVYGKEGKPSLKDLEQEKALLQLKLVQAKEVEEVAMIKRLKLSEGDKLEPNGLTKHQAFACKLFNEAYTSRRELPETQKKFVQEFLVSILGNPRLNKALGRDDILSRFTYKTRNPEIFLAAAEKLLKIANNQEGTEIKDEDRLSLREYGILLDYTSMLSDFNGPSRVQLLEDNGTLKSLYDKVNEIKPILENVSKSITEEASKKINSGDLLLNHIERRAEIANKKVDAREKFSLLITKHLHTVKLVQKDEGVFISHAHSRGRGTDEFNVRVYLFSDVYTLDIKPLINKGFEEKLKAKYGDDYAEAINKKYKGIEKNLHQNTGEKFANVALRADSEYIKTFFADFIGYLGHNKLVAEDLDLIHADIMNGAKEKNRMLCSEFAARTTVAAFIELNNKLKEKLGKELGIEVEEDVINIPFSNRERFRTMHPDRLLEILSDKGCIKEMERTETEKKYFSFANKVTEQKAAKSTTNERG